jgi:choline dehydrogenase-like flavoprotein
MVVTTGSEASDIQAAVAIVGAGPAGISLALALARANIDTVIIESGGERADVLASQSAAAISPENHAPLELASPRRLGGATWTWGGRCVDMDPIDFEPSIGAEAPGWPITYEDATAEATAAAGFLGIGRPHFEVQLDCLGTESVLRTRLERWCADPRLVRQHATDIRTNTKARFYTGLTCTGIAFDASGRQALGLRVKHRSGLECLVTARHYVLAAGGLETARLLLASIEAAHQGTGHTSEWLGRNYLGHFEGAIADIVLDGLSEDALDYRLDGAACFVRPRLMLSPETLRRNGLRNIAFLPTNHPLGDWRHQSAALSTAALALYTPILGRTLQPGPVRDILLGQPLKAADLGHHLRNIIGDVPSIFSFALQAVVGQFQRPHSPGMFVRNKTRRYSLKYIAEQSPSYASRILLSHDRDGLGMPRIIIKKSVSSGDVKSILRAHDFLDLELRRLNLGRLEYLAEPADRSVAATAHGADGYHQIGLVRMGDDERSSVVDAHCTMHSVSNLHIASSAVFPTSGQANPTFLIVCLALRLANRLIADLKGQSSLQSGLLSDISTN